ncbi:phage gp6-like head-tail connector protein [Citrobacter sp. OP27]
MNERELAIIKTVSETFGEALSSLQESFAKHLEQQRQEFEERFSRLSKSMQEMVDSPGPDLSAIARDAAALVPAPEIPELPDINALVVSAVQALPAPAAGKSVTVDDVKPMLEKLVKTAVSEITVPDAPELPDINALVTAAVQALAVPEPSKNGTDGRDALQLEVAPFIDKEKSYPRGSYATHAGGLWRSYEKTYGMRGWECLVDGVSGIDVANADERNFTVTVTRASGAVETKTFAVPTLIYRGVFKAGEVYKPGDTVTWGGSMWHCDEESADKPGENGSKGWTLATKRGRDGRDKT